MKALFRALFSATSILFLLQFVSAQVPPMTPFSADMEISSKGDQGLRDAQGKVFVGSGHMRMNLESNGRETSIITDFATKTVDILLAQQQMYIEHTAGEGPGRGPGVGQDLRPYDPDHPCAIQPELTCKKVGVEVVNGRTCDHWEMTDKDGKVANFWIDQKLHFPIKTVSQNSTMLLSNIKEGEPDASLFRIPSGYHRMDLRGMVPPGAGGPPQN